MKQYEQFVDEIISKKGEISKAIALAVSGGNEERAKKYFPSFYKMISESKMFIFEEKRIFSKYEKEVDAILDRIGECFGHRIHGFFYNGISFGYAFDPLKAKSVEGIPVEEERNLHKAYLSCSKMFLKLDITYDDFVKFYRREGFENSIRLAREVKTLQKKTMMYDLKKDFSSFSAFVSFSRKIEKFGDLAKKYNISSLDDFMKFHSEVSSFFVDTSTLSEEEKVIIEENKKSFLNRVKDKNIVNNVHKLEKIRRQCESFFNDEFIKKIFLDTNLRDFFDRYSISLSKENLRNIANMCLHTMCVSGTRTFLEIDGKYESVVFIRSNVYKSDSFWQNSVTIHEHVHCLESVNTSSLTKNFNVKCNALNEAMTEFIAKEALKYLSSNILEDNDVQEGIKHECVYDCMFPLLDVLKNSELWEDLLFCKLNNDYCFLEERIGKNASRIANIFEEVYAKRNVGNYNVEEAVGRLEEIVSGIEKENGRYHKKVAI